MRTAHGVGTGLIHVYRVQRQRFSTAIADIPPSLRLPPRPAPPPPPPPPSRPPKVPLSIVVDGELRPVSVRRGDSVLLACQDNDVTQLEGACGGSMQCSTCHVILSPAVFGSYDGGVVSDAELDLLDKAADVTSTSRLGCQLVVDERLNNAVIIIPSRFHKQM